MKIGIICAMDEELDAYKKHTSRSKAIKLNSFTFYTGNWDKQEVIIVKSGVGKVFAAMTCQLMIDKFSPDHILFTGVAGALNKKLDIGDIVISIDTAHHDFNAMSLGFKRGQISYTPYRFFKAEKKLIAIALKTKIKGQKIIKGRILTGDQFFTQADKKKHSYLIEELKGDCIEMEGAAVGQVCHINNVPHIIIRTMSDKADGSAVNDYNKFKSKIASNSLAVVENLLKNV